MVFRISNANSHPSRKVARLAGPMVQMEYCFQKQVTKARTSAWNSVCGFCWRSHDSVYLYAIQEEVLRRDVIMLKDDKSCGRSSLLLMVARCAVMPGPVAILCR